jgi:hypothetical protein
VPKTFALLAVAVCTGAAVATAQLIPPPAGMTRTPQRTVQCARTLATFSVTISSNGGPFSIDVSDNRQYGSVSIDNENALVRTEGCRVLARAPAVNTRVLGRRWALQQRFFETKQFGCRYRGPLVLNARAVRSGGRYVNRLTVWSNRGRLFAQGELANGRGWLRVASACSLTYSR